MKSKIGRLAAVSIAGALLAACHGNFYGGGDVGAGYAGPVASNNAPATATSSMARSTTSTSDVSGATATADKP